MGIIPCSFSIYLGALSIQDLRKKSVPIISLIPGGLLMIGSIFLGESISWQQRLLGGGVGFLIVLLSFVTKEAIGMADALNLLILGISVGFYRFSILLVVSFSICCLVSMVAMGFRVMKRKQRIPFLPFLLGGYLSCWFFGGV